MPDSPRHGETTRLLSEAIASAIDNVVNSSSLQELAPALKLIGSQHSLDADVALDVVETVARKMPGLVSVLEANANSVQALRLIEASVRVLTALRASVPVEDRSAFDLLLDAGSHREKRLRERIEADSASPGHESPGRPQDLGQRSDAKVTRPPTPAAFHSGGGSAHGMRPYPGQERGGLEADRSSSIERDLK